MGVGFEKKVLDVPISTSDEIGSMCRVRGIVFCSGGGEALVMLYGSGCAGTVMSIVCLVKAAASILGGKKVCVRRVVAPASGSGLLKAVHDRVVKTLLSAGAVILPPGCGPCPGAHQGEAGLSTVYRIFKGRMGAGGFIYLAPPETAAVTALAGEIADPRDVGSL